MTERRARGCTSKDPSFEAIAAPLRLKPCLRYTCSPSVLDISNVFSTRGKRKTHQASHPDERPHPAHPPSRAHEATTLSQPQSSAPRAPSPDSANLYLTSASPLTQAADKTHDTPSPRAPSHAPSTSRKSPSPAPSSSPPQIPSPLRSEEHTSELQSQ